MDDFTVIPVFESSSEVEVALYRSMLQEAGIFVLERSGGDPVTHMPMFRFAVQCVQLCVRPEDARWAQQLVSDYARHVTAGEYALRDDDQPDEAQQEPEAPPSSGKAINIVDGVGLVILAFAFLYIITMVYPAIRQFCTDWFR